jgi:hypothetical protein
VEEIDAAAERAFGIAEEKVKEKSADAREYGRSRK